RLTGRVAGLQIGVLDIQTGDLTERDPIAGVDQQIAPNNNFGVVRAFKELDNRTRIGAIVVSRVNTDETDDHNLTYGIDGRLGIGQDLTFEGWASLTSTPQASGGGSGEGFNDGEYGFSVGGEYFTRDWEAALGYMQIGAAFNPEVGFVNRW